MQNADADLTRKMKRYHEQKQNTEQFVQQPVLVFQVCAYRLVTFFNDGYERAERTVVENNTRNKHWGQNRAVCWRRHTNTNHQTGGAACFIFGFDIGTRGGVAEQ